MNKKLEEANTLGERLYILRENHKLSQDELAEKLNVSRQTISNWENDKVKLDVVKASEICRIYDISMDELLLGRESGIKKSQSKKRSSTRLAIMIVSLVISFLLIIVGIICLATAKGDETSSTIIMGKSVIWYMAILGGAIACSIILFYFFKKK